MTNDVYQKICIAALAIRGWKTDRADRRGLRNSAGWLSHFDPDFKERGTLLIPIELLRDPTCTLVCVGNSEGFFVIAKPHLRREVAAQRASLNDSKTLLVVPVAVAMELSIIALKIEVTTDES